MKRTAKVVSLFDDPEKLKRDTEAALAKREARAKEQQPKKRAQRLQPLLGAYVRVPLQWLRGSPKPIPLSHDARLFLYLLYNSHWGQREVRVTNELAAEVGVSERTKERGVIRLVRVGWIRVERREEPAHTPVVTVVIPT